MTASNPVMPTSKIPTIEYETILLKDVTLGRAAPKQQARTITSVSINARKLIPTTRFMTSFCAIYGLSPSVFNYFSPDEVIERIVEVKGSGNESADQKVRIAVEKSDHREVVLAVSRVNKPILTKNDIELILASSSVDESDIAYSTGIVTSIHKPRIGGDSKFTVMNDAFSGRFIVETPIDGYGTPAAYLTLMTIPNDGGSVVYITGYSKVFRSQVALGTEQGDAVDTMMRFLESFNNEEGFAAMRQRMMAAANSPASLDEFFSIYEIIIDDSMASLHVDANGNYCKPFGSVVVDRLKKLCGSLETYGLVSYESLSKKKRRTIPTAGRLYDLLMFVAELASKANPQQARKLNEWTGRMLSNEYDLEGVLENTGEDPEELFEGDLRSGKEKFALTGERQVLDDIIGDDDDADEDDNE